MHTKLPRLALPSRSASPPGTRRLLVADLHGRIRLFFSVLLLVSLAGCDWLLGPREPQEVTVEISSDHVSSAQLVTSQLFILVPDPECVGQQDCHQRVHLEAADTTTISLPFEHTYRFSDRHQFHSKVHPTAEVVATLTMVVKIDGKDWYNDFRELQVWAPDGSREAITFTYQYQVITEPQVGG